jgi:hypothetical protein
LQFDYTAVGHVTIDVFANGSRRAGGTAFYSALQAARMGQRALILTQGVPREIEELMEPHRHELALEVIPAPATTTLQTSGSGSARRQRVLAWAGVIERTLELDTAILHLAPVARETPTSWRGRSAFVGLTPQGLARVWAQPDGEISLAPPPAAAVRVAERCEAIVLSEHERTSCRRLISRAHEAGAVVAITAGERPSTILLPGGGNMALEVPAVATPGDDLGAGDVFAAAFFIALHEGDSPERAARFAAAAGAVRLQGHGAAAIGGRQAIEAQLRTAAP